MSKYAIMVTAADGRTDIIGPYTSDKRAQRHADLIYANGASGASADVYVMDPPSNYKEYLPEKESQ